MKKRIIKKIIKKQLFTVWLLVASKKDIQKEYLAMINDKYCFKWHKKHYTKNKLYHLKNNYV